MPFANRADERHTRVIFREWVEQRVDKFIQYPNPKFDVLREDPEFKEGMVYILYKIVAPKLTFENGTKLALKYEWILKELRQIQKQYR